MHDDKGSDDKVICVPVSDPNWNFFESLNDVPKQLQDEISHFFAIYKDLEQKEVKVEGWFGVMEAWKQIEEAHKRWDEAHPEG
jgi:inorganic pyrophosphatase